MRLSAKIPVVMGYSTHTLHDLYMSFPHRRCSKVLVGVAEMCFAHLLQPKANVAAAP